MYDTKTMIPSSAKNKNRKKTSEEFSKDVQELYGDKYDCSKVEYINNKTQVILICNEHGEFSSRPNDILGGHCCKKCGEERMKTKIIAKTDTLEDFIIKSKLIHGDKYSYDKTIYKNSRTKLTITCKKHGDFTKYSNHHLNIEGGCKECNRDDKLLIDRPEITEKFIEKSKEVHSDKFDYSKTKYIRITDKVIIICPKHGEFEQTPGNHLNFNCLKCSIENVHKKQKKSTEQFIIDSIKVHGDLYDYSSCDYKSAHEKVQIICKTHGIFEQLPASHTNSKSGCNRCSIYVKENRCIKFLEDLTNYKFVKQRHSFIKNKINKSLELDGYNDELKLAIEYNGEQHYKIIDFFHRNGIVDLLKQVENDKIKQEKCTENGVYLITVPYYTNNLEKFIRNEYEKYEFLSSFNN